MARFRRALVKLPPDTYGAALTAAAQPLDVDLDLARRQHARYVAVLGQLGLEVRSLEPSCDFPDSCFIQDVACAIDDRLIVGRPGAESRRGEPATIMDALVGTGRELRHIREPATLDCGDLLVTESALFVGLSSRTNQAALDQLQAQVRRPVIGVPLAEGLHLLSSCSYLGDSRLLVTAQLAGAPEPRGFERLILPPEENYAANVLVIGCDVIIAAGFPQADKILSRAGLRPHPVELSEFAKRDGGPTCLSLVY